MAEKKDYVWHPDISLGDRVLLWRVRRAGHGPAHPHRGGQLCRLLLRAEEAGGQGAQTRGAGTKECDVDPVKSLYLDLEYNRGPKSDQVQLKSVFVFINGLVKEGML